MTRSEGALAGRRIVVTRARAQAQDLADRLTALGAEVVQAPVIRIEPLEHLEPLHRALGRMYSYDWVLFTSQNTVEIVCTKPEVFAHTSVAAIGPATAAALADRGIAVALVPERHVSEGLVEALLARGVKGKRFLLPTAERARPVLQQGLESQGALVDVVPVYRTIAEGGDGRGLANELSRGAIDAVTFTAASTVEHFVGLVGRDAATCGHYAAAVIGPITAQMARDHGITTGGLIEASPQTTAGLVAAVTRHFAR
jgi:uroporphyrinogen III methyltransferase/synthase